MFQPKKFGSFPTVMKMVDDNRRIMIKRLQKSKNLLTYFEAYSLMLIKTIFLYGKAEGENRDFQVLIVVGERGGFV